MNQKRIIKIVKTLNNRIDDLFEEHELPYDLLPKVGAECIKFEPSHFLLSIKGRCEFRFNYRFSIGMYSPEGQPLATVRDFLSQKYILQLINGDLKDWAKDLKHSGPKNCEVCIDRPRLARQSLCKKCWDECMELVNNPPDLGFNEGGITYGRADYDNDLGDIYALDISRDENGKHAPLGHIKTLREMGVRDEGLEFNPWWG